MTASPESHPSGHIYVPQPPGTTTDLYEIRVRGQAPFDIDGTHALVTRFVSVIRRDPPPSLRQWRQQLKDRGRKTTAPEFILLGTRGGVVYPPPKLRPRPDDHEQIRRADGSVSIATSTDLDGPHVSFRLGFNVVDTTAPKGLPEPTVFLDGSVGLYRDTNPSPMVELLGGDLRRLMRDLDPFVRTCEIWIQASAWDTSAAPVPVSVVTV